MEKLLTRRPHGPCCPGGSDGCCHGSSLGCSQALPLAAHAARLNTVKAVTLSSNRADTTSASGPYMGTLDQGPVWGHDNLSFQFSAVPNSCKRNKEAAI